MQEDPFPHEDIVWGMFACLQLRLRFVSVLTSPWFFIRSIGVAFTIDPAYTAEVRAYLGTQYPTTASISLTTNTPLALLVVLLAHILFTHSDHREKVP
jgi:hypothetical protein